MTAFFYRINGIDLVREKRGIQQKQSESIKAFQIRWFEMKEKLRMFGMPMSEEEEEICKLLEKILLKVAVRT